MLFCSQITKRALQFTKNRRNATMAKKNYENLAKEIVRYIGGVENVNTLIHCATRLRFKVKNTQNVDKKKLEQLEGVITVLDSGGQIQVVIGQHVADVYDTIFEVTDLKKENQSDAVESGEKKNLLNTFMDTISGISGIYRSKKIQSE
jgi:PTS system beta-glucosides-specific IIC component